MHLTYCEPWPTYFLFTYTDRLASEVSNSCYISIVSIDLTLLHGFFNVPSLGVVLDIPLRFAYSILVAGVLFNMKLLECTFFFTNNLVILAGISGVINYDTLCEVFYFTYECMTGLGCPH